MVYLPEERGQGLIRFALILILVAIVVIVMLAVVGPALGELAGDLIEGL